MSNSKPDFLDMDKDGDKEEPMKEATKAKAKGKAQAFKDKKTEDWINVADISHDDEGNPLASSDWRDKYDIYSTPVVYLLDDKKKIIAKRINYKQFAEIITRK